MIEFNCTECGKKLKVGNDAAGRRGKCPQCGATVDVPELDKRRALNREVAQAEPSSGFPAAPTVGGLERSPDRMPARVTQANLDFHSRIAAWIGAAGLLLLMLSPLFKWMKLGSIDIIGIKGDGKIVLAVSVLALLAFVVPILAKKHNLSLLLASQAWASVAIFWMAGLIWKYGGILDDAEIRDNPFARILASGRGPFSLRGVDG